MKNRQLTTTQKAAVIKKVVGIGVIVASALSLARAVVIFTEAGGNVGLQKALTNDDKAPLIRDTPPSRSESSAVEQPRANPDFLGKDQSHSESSAVERLLATPVFVDKNPSGGWTRLDQHEVIEYMPLPDAAPPVQASDGSGIDYKIISLIPTEETAFRNIFKTEMSLSAKREMEKYQRLFGEFDNSTILSTSGESETDFYRLLKEDSDGKTIMIVAHSEAINSARYLILPNGYAQSIPDIYKTCRELGANCLIVTCYSDDISLLGTINLEDARRMILAATTRLEAIQRGDVSVPDDIQEALPKVMREEMIRRRASRLSLIGVTTVAGGGGLIYMVVSKYE